MSIDKLVCTKCLDHLQDRAGGTLLYVPKRPRLDGHTARRLRDNGKTVRGIAKAFGLSDRRVYQLLVSVGAQNRANTRE